MSKTLTPKEEKFCHAIVAGENQSDAYRLAYNAKRMKADTINNKAYQLMQKGDIRARVAELRAPVVQAVQKDRIEWLREIQRCAFFDIRQLLDENGNIKAFDQVSDDALPAVAGLEVEEVWEGHGKDRTQTGETKKLKLVDRLAALTLFGKATGFLQEKERRPSALEEFGAEVLMQLREEAKRRIEAKGLKVPG